LIEFISEMILASIHGKNDFVEGSKILLNRSENNFVGPSK